MLGVSPVTEGGREGESKDGKKEEGKTAKTEREARRERKAKILKVYYLLPVPIDC